jgi:hypothetical protein
MGIALGTERKARTPIVQRARIGDELRAAVVFMEPREQRNEDGTPKLKKDNKSVARELVVDLVIMPGTTMIGRLNKQDYTLEPGDAARVILKGGAWSQWIDAERTVPNGIVNVGDLLWMNTTHGETYDINGRVTGRIDDQAALDAHNALGRRADTVGLRGELKLKRDDVKYAEWVAKAEQAHHERNAAARQPIPASAPAAAADFDDDPF